MVAALRKSHHLTKLSFFFFSLPALFCIRVGIKQAWQLFEGLASFSAAWANGVLSTEPDSQLQLCVCVCAFVRLCVSCKPWHTVCGPPVCVPDADVHVNNVCEIAAWPESGAGLWKICQIHLLRAGRWTSGGTSGGFHARRSQIFTHELSRENSFDDISLQRHGISNQSALVTLLFFFA